LIHLYLDRAWVLGLARLLVDTKIEGATPGKNLCKKTRKSRNSCIVSGRGVGAEGMVTRNAID